MMNDVAACWRPRPQVGLALVDVYSEALLAAADVLDAFQVVQGMAALTHDASHLLAVAMVKFGALDEAQLAGLRQQAQTHVEREEAEEERLEVGRQQRQQQQQQVRACTALRLGALLAQGLSDGGLFSTLERPA